MGTGAAAARTRPTVSRWKAPASALTPRRWWSCELAMIRAAALVKPEMTGTESSSTSMPSRSSPRASRRTPTIRASRIEQETKASVPAAATDPTAAALIREAMATGPVAKWREEPQKAAITGGRKAA